MRTFTLTCLLVLLALPAAAEDQEELEGHFTIEGYFRPVAVAVKGLDDLDEEFFGVRSAYRLTDRFQVEGALSTHLENPGDFVLLDLAARYSYKETRRFDFFVLGGASYRYAKYSRFFASRRSNDQTFINFGLGLEVDLSKRLYLRHDWTSRFDRLEGDSIFLDLTLGLGFRL